MPPKVRVNKQDIIDAALKLVRENGEEALNARALAVALNCSTQPIFSNFAGMDELKAELLREAYRIYENYGQKEIKKNIYPEYKAIGMAYIRFAKERKELFKLLFMRNRSKSEQNNGFAEIEHVIKLIQKSNKMTREAAEKFHLEHWIYVHGIAVMYATDYLELDIDTVSSIMSDVHHGLVLQHTKEGKK